MLYPNEEVLQYLTETSGKLIHLYGEPDAGRTQTLFSILDTMTKQDKLCSYWIPNREQYRENVFNKAVAEKEHCIIGFPKTTKELPAFLKLADGADLICVDNFLEYILHKQNGQIRGVFALFSAAAYQYKTNFVLVNDLRYLEAKGGMHPAYQEYFSHFCAKHISVEKDSDFHIRYAFRELS